MAWKKTDLKLSRWPATCLDSLWPPSCTCTTGWMWFTATSSRRTSCLTATRRRSNSQISLVQEAIWLRAFAFSIQKEHRASRRPSATWSSRKATIPSPLISGPSAFVYLLMWQMAACLSTVRANLRSKSPVDKMIWYFPKAYRHNWGNFSNGSWKRILQSAPMLNNCFRTVSLQLSE